MTLQSVPFKAASRTPDPTFLTSSCTANCTPNCSPGPAYAGETYIDLSFGPHNAIWAYAPKRGTTMTARRARAQAYAHNRNLIKPDIHALTEA